MIKIKNVEIGFSTCLFTIDNIFLEKGKLYTLIGKNGTGKSTFLKTLAELNNPLKGTIEWENYLPKEQRIAFVSSKFDGVEHLTTYEYIALGRAPYTNIFGKLTPRDHSEIIKISNMLNISNLLENETTKISDGERQIASIGKALAQNTELIILDEPIAFLDFENKNKIICLLSKIAKERNCSIIHSSHDLDISIKYADEILIINPIEKRLLQLDKKTINNEEIIKISFPNALPSNT
jgi:iron complex transport system ATP-binding protein